MQTAGLLTYLSSPTNIRGEMTDNCPMNPILELRKQLGVSQSELAAAIGVTQSAISQFEKDSATPSPDTVKKLIDFARTRGVEVSFDSIYAPTLRNCKTDRAAASDDTQGDAGGSVDDSKPLKMAEA